LSLGIGIDTGGTFTDSVIVEIDSGRVISKAKALTTKQDLKIGVKNSLDGLDKSLFQQVRLVSLSTTLATNSVVEGKGSRVGLIMAVPNPATFAFQTDVPPEDIAIIAGAHNKNGEVSTGLDMAGATEAIHGMLDRVDAFAVSSYFSIYNAEHEVKIKELVTSACLRPVVCGHELSGHVGMVERAATAVLNAQLLPVIRELIEAVKDMLADNGIAAPLMVVKGDGTLIAEHIAVDKPVETVLSGPAASVVGACELTGLRDAIVVDMGGTTTDIGIVRSGVVTTSDEGAVVGGRQTRVQAVDMLTVGLGGDSKIAVASPQDIRIGPRRATPLCSTASQFPAIKDALSAMLSVRGKRLNEFDLDFFTLIKRPGFVLSKHEQALIDALDDRVLHRDLIYEQIGPFVDVERFVELGFVAEVSFTPTDALHAGGELDIWDSEVASLAADVLAGKAGLGRDELLERIFREIIERLKLHITTKALFDDDAPGLFRSDTALKFLDYLLRLNGESGVSADLALKRPIIAVGAPVGAYFPQVARELGTRLVIPEHSEVANAVGAITGRVIERAEAYIRPDKQSGFVVVATDIHTRFGALDDAVFFAENYVRSVAAERATQSGGSSIDVTIDREEVEAPLASGWGDAVFMELKLIATATGKPLT